MKAGFYETDITPALGMERPGNYGKCYLTSFHDPLKVRAAVLDDGRQRVALVGVDTCTIAARTVAAARAGIRARCGIRGDHVLIAASHTHSGGPLFGFLPSDFDGAPPLIQELAVNQSTVIDPLYHDWAVSQIITAVCEADRIKQPVRLSIGSGVEGAASFNRRFKMNSGRAATHPGKGNPAIVAPAGPIDPEVGVVGAWTRDGELLGCVVNFACHNTTAPGGISADWVYYLEQTIRGAMGGRTGVVFLNGACGDITQVDNRSLRDSEFGEKWARLVGARVGAEAVKVLVTAESAERMPLAAASRTLKLKRRPASARRLARSRAIVQSKTDRRSPEWIFAKERVVLDYLAQRQPAVNVELQALQVGPAVFLANPAEYFCEFGLQIKQESQFPLTYVVSLANGAIGYVPTAEALGPNGGGYETLLTGYSNLEVAAGDKIAAASLRLAAKFKPGRVPEPPQVKGAGEFKATPWGYGAMGPDLD